jgi:hypothetical protein
VVPGSAKWARLEDATPTRLGDFLGAPTLPEALYIHDVGLPLRAPQLFRDGFSVPKYFANDFLQVTSHVSLVAVLLLLIGFLRVIARARTCQLAACTVRRGRRYLWVLKAPVHRFTSTRSRPTSGWRCGLGTSGALRSLRFALSGAHLAITGTLCASGW